MVSCCVHSDVEFFCSVNPDDLRPQTSDLRLLYILGSWAADENGQLSGVIDILAPLKLK